MSTHDNSLGLAERYRILAENTLECIWCLDASSQKFTYISPSIFRLRGLTVEEAMNERLEDSLTPESLQRAVSTLTASITAYMAGLPVDEKSQLGEYQQYHKNGTIVDVEISTILVKNSTTGALEVIGVSRDITRRKALQAAIAEQMRQKTEALEALRLSQAYLMHAQALSHMGNWYLDLATRTLTGSEEAFRMLGRNPETPLTLPEFLESVLPEDRHIPQQGLSDAMAGMVYPVEYRILVHGSVRWFESIADPEYDSTGQLVAVKGVIHDITERVENQRRLDEYRLHLEETTTRLNLAIEAANVGIWICDLPGDIYRWDERMCVSYGLSPDMAGKPVSYALWSSMLHPDDIQAADKLHESMDPGASGKPIPHAEEFRIIRPDGSVRFMVMGSAIEYDISGKPVRIVGISKDITTQREFEQNLKTANAELARHRDHLEDLVHARTRELAQARDDAESASRAKSAFLSTISHELRTPLSQITGLAYLASRDSVQTKVKQRLTAIDQAAGRMLKLIGGVLDFTAAESGRLILEEKDVSLATLLGRLHDRYAQAIADKGLEFIQELDPALPATLRGDPVRIAQVLEILMDNAIKYSEHGKITLRIFQSSLSASSVRVRFEVQDQGIGLPPELQSQPFILLSQGDNSTTRKYEGIGLGMSLARRLVLLMAGEMEHTSAPGQGTMFSFTIPLGRSRGIGASGGSTGSASTGSGDTGAGRTENTGAIDWALAASLLAYIDILLQSQDPQAWSLWNEFRTTLEPAIEPYAYAFAAAMEARQSETALVLLREAVENNPALSPG